MWPAIGSIIVGLGGGYLLTLVSPLIGIPVAIIFMGFGIFLLIQPYTNKVSTAISATQLYDRELGKHLARIKVNLEKWQNHLLSSVDNRNLDYVRLPLEKSDDFKYIRRHCPTIDAEYADFMVGVGLCKVRYQELKAKKSREEDVNYNKGLYQRYTRKMASLVCSSLASNEYLRNTCFACPKNGDGA